MLRRLDDGAVLACGQYAREGDLVGLYDVFTTGRQLRNQGLSRALCAELLRRAAAEGAPDGLPAGGGRQRPGAAVYAAGWAFRTATTTTTARPG
jgi:GNAT superfamily N-acetyltransferase